MPNESAELNVLCVAGEPASADNVAGLLEAVDDKITATGVADETRVLEQLETEPVDCVLSAHQLGSIDGIQLLQTLRARYPDLPFVLYTGSGSESLASEAIAAGASDYIPAEFAETDHASVVARLRAVVSRHQSTRERLEQHERAARVLDACPDAIIVSVENSVVYANRSAGELFGKPATELQEADPAALTGTPSAFWTVDGKVANELDHQKTVHMRNADRQREIEITATAIHWKEQPAVVAVLRDVEASASEEYPQTDWKLEGVINTVSAAIFIKDTEGQYLLMNESCRELLGIDSEHQVVGLTDDELFESAVAQQFLADDQRVFEQRETIEIEETVPTAAGERQMLTRKTPLLNDDGVPYALCAVSTDITRQKEREHALGERVKELAAIHRTVRLFEQMDRSVETVLEEFITGLPDSFQYPDHAQARIEYGEYGCATAAFDDVTETISSESVGRDGTLLTVSVGYDSAVAEDAFLSEEKRLLDTLSTVLSGYLERREQLEQLQRYEATLRALGDPVYALDADGRFTFVNDALLERTGYDRETLLGEHISILLSEQAVTTGRKVIRELINGDRQTAKYELDLVTKEGEYIPVENHVALLPAPDGEFRGTAGVIRDVSERVGREEELRRRKDLLVRTEQMANVGGWELNLETEELYWSEGTRQIHEVDSSFEPSMETALNFYHESDQAWISEAIERLRQNGTPFEYEATLTTAKGHERQVRVSGERVTENETPKLRGTIHDITKLRESEQQLMVLNRVLRHNLRNNLNVVTANAELLRQALDPLETLATLPPEIRKQIPETASRAVTAEDSVDREALKADLESICELPVEKLFDQLAGIESNAWELLAIAEKSRRLSALIEQLDREETVDVSSLLEDIVEEQELAHPDATIALETAPVKADGTAPPIRLAVEELVENALKHSGEQPTVTVTAAQATSQQVELVIEDDGPGLPAIEREALESGEETALKHGSGLGLWTVNWLLARLGGAVEIEECQDGTRIRLLLPAA